MPPPKKKAARKAKPAKPAQKTKPRWEPHPGGRPERVPGGSRAGQLAVGLSAEERADLDAQAQRLSEELGRTITSGEAVRMALRALGWIRAGRAA